jgi:hypothetical protein
MAERRTTKIDVYNNIGLFTGGGGGAVSYKNNNLNGNATADGAFTASSGNSGNISQRKIWPADDRNGS